MTKQTCCHSLVIVQQSALNNLYIFHMQATIHTQTRFAHVHVFIKHICPQMVINLDSNNADLSSNHGGIFF